MKRLVEDLTPIHAKEMAELLYDKYGISVFPEPKEVSDCIESAIYFLGRLEGWIETNGTENELARIRQMCRELYNIDSKYSDFS